MSLRAEREKTGGRRRLASDLYKIMMNDTEVAGYSIEPRSEESMDTWTIRLFGFDGDSNLHRDMLVVGIDHIELEMGFPDGYPFEPPFVRVVRPRFQRQTGFVMNGALCMELLTAEGWNPVNDIESVIVSIRSLLVVGDGRLEAAARIPKERYAALVAAAEAEAKAEAEAGSGAGAGTGDGAGDGDGEGDGTGSPGPAADAASGADGGGAGAERDWGGEGRKRRRCGDGGGIGGGMGAGERRTGGGAGEPSPSSSSSSASKRARAAYKADAGSYSTAEAKSAYSHLTDYHKKKGWDQSGWWARKG